jgi:hypothetical protein
MRAPVKHQWDHHRHLPILLIKIGRLLDQYGIPFFYRLRVSPRGRTRAHRDQAGPETAAISTNSANIQVRPLRPGYPQRRHPRASGRYQRMVHPDPSIDASVKSCFKPQHKIVEAL